MSVRSCCLSFKSSVFLLRFCLRSNALRGNEFTTVIVYLSVSLGTFCAIHLSPLQVCRSASIFPLSVLILVNCHFSCYFLITLGRDINFTVLLRTDFGFIDFSLAFFTFSILWISAVLIWIFSFLLVLEVWFDCISLVS
jgi:hypothetical protein